jgi:alkylation response protein AidB-like acyl-CoA dehydrogenase
MQDLGRIGFTEAQADLLEVASVFCRQKSPPARVRQLITDELGHDPSLWREIAALGWLGVAIPEPYGGSGLGLAEVVPIMEQMGRHLMNTPFASTTLTAQALLAGGTEAQKETWLPKLAAGAVGALALSEAKADWDLRAIETIARPTGGGYSLLGEKVLVWDAAAAEVVIVSVLLDGRPALALIEAAQLPHGALRRETVIDETKRSFALTLEGVVVPGTAIMESERAGEALNHIHLSANLLAAAEMCGGTQAAIDYTLDYLKTRKQFGRPIGAYQALKHPMVEAYLKYEQARSHLYAAAHCFGEQGTGEIAVRMAKAVADQVFAFAADRAIQFHGGYGFTYDCDAQLYRRRALWHAAHYGDSAYHKAKLEALLLGSNALV